MSLKPVVNYPIRALGQHGYYPQRPQFNAGDSLVSVPAKGGCDCDGGYGTRAGYRRNPWPKFARDWLRANPGYSWGNPFVRKTIVAQYKAAALKGTRKTRGLNVYKMKKAEIEARLLKLGYKKKDLYGALKPELAKELSRKLKKMQQHKTIRAQYKFK